MITITKRDLVQRISEDTGVQQQKAKDIGDGADVEHARGLAWRRRAVKHRHGLPRKRPPTLRRGGHARPAAGQPRWISEGSSIGSRLVAAKVRPSVSTATASCECRLS